MPCDGNPGVIYCKAGSFDVFLNAIHLLTMNPHRSGGISLTDLSMTTALGYRCHVSVETLFHDSQWFLVLDMSISDCLRSKCAGKHSALDLPVAILNARRNPQSIAHFLLFPSNEEKASWQAIWTVPVASVWCPPEFTVTFWHRAYAKWGEAFKIATWEVTVCGTPEVSRYLPPRSN